MGRVQCSIRQSPRWRQSWLRVQEPLTPVRCAQDPAQIDETQIILGRVSQYVDTLAFDSRLLRVALGLKRYQDRLAVRLVGLGPWLPRAGRGQAKVVQSERGTQAAEPCGRIGRIANRAERTTGGITSRARRTACRSSGGSALHRSCSHLALHAAPPTAPPTAPAAPPTAPPTPAARTSTAARASPE